MIVCCTNNTRDAQFGLFVCARVYFWFQHHQILVQCSRCLFPHSSVANAAPAALWIHLVLFLMLHRQERNDVGRVKKRRNSHFVCLLYDIEGIVPMC